MKVELGSQNIHQNSEREIGAYQNYSRQADKAQNPKRANQAGFSLDISGNGDASAAYGMAETLKSADELMAEAGNLDTALQKDMMTVMSSTMSKEDYAEFAKDGYSVSDMSMDEQVTSLDRLKAKLAESGTVVKGYNDDLSDEDLAEITGDAGLAGRIRDALQENDLPVNQENVKGITSALEKAGNIAPLSEGALKYMVTNNLEPSVDNLYKAEYSAGNNGSRQGQGYYRSDADGYYAKKADTIEWDQLKGQAEQIVRSAGLPVDDTTMDQAKWLIEQGIPLTEETLNSLNTIKELSFPLSGDQTIGAMAIGIADGKGPAAASLTAETTIIEKAVALHEELQEIEDEAVSTVVQNGEELNLRNLKEAQDSITDVTVMERSEILQDDAFISAKRQLEETRLAMTFEANLRLLRQGVAIETAPLSALVEQLKEADKAYFVPQLLKDGEAFANDAAKNNAIDTRLTLYKQTVTAFEALRTIPLETISGIDTEGEGFTARQVLSAAEPIAERYRRAENSYEALMTAPRQDMGDSIRKAFQNVDEILSDNGYEANEENRRAVRALGYAEMEINEQAIDRVKEADQALRQVISRMNPVKTLEMIRNGDNPLDENIFELQNRLNSERTPAQETEKYSKFLVRLERKGELTEDEKDAFIGMYRLFRQIEKSDGKLLGNVLNENGDLTLRNLLSASRSNRALAGGMNYTVDDDFGGLEKVIARGRSISEQIDGGFAKSALHQGSLRYNEQLVGEILEKLTPESLSINELSEDTTLGELYDRVESSYQNRGLSEEEVTADYEEDVALRRQAAEVEDSVIEALRNSRIPVTTDNVLAENVLMNQRGSTFGRLMDQAAKARTTKDSSSAPEEGKNGNVNGKSMYDKLVEAFGEVTDNFDSYENAGEMYIEAL
ncbi:MAG: hypothetical protein IJ073_00230, partial [Lachnospiraceae bacterium]|nr:hypothetical protein [Lachnospiraceae bacterium]